MIKILYCILYSDRSPIVIPALVRPVQEKWPEKCRLTFSSRSLLGSTSHSSDRGPHWGSELRSSPSMNHWTWSSWLGLPDTTSQNRVTFTFMELTLSDSESVFECNHHQVTVPIFHLVKTGDMN